LLIGSSPEGFMASILVTSSPLVGHVTPSLAVAAELVTRGHRVRFLTGRHHREQVEAAGAELLPLPAEVDFDHRDMNAAFPQIAGMTGIRGMSALVLEVLAKPIDGQFEALTAALADEPDVILSEMMFAGVYPLALLPRTARPAIGILGISPLPLTGPGLPPYGLGLLPATNRGQAVRNHILRTITNKVVLGPVQRHLAAATKRLVHRRLPCPFLDMPTLGDALFHLGVEAFEYPRPHVRPRPIFIGPVTRAGTPLPPPPWHHDLVGRRVVHVTQGTLANDDFSALVAPTVRALANDDCLVVVTGGGRPEAEVEASLVASLGSLPANVRIGAYLDYTWLFPHLDVLVTNGGYGAVNLALRHGVPIVVAGDTEEKPEVGARVQWAGAGLMLRRARPSPSEVKAAIQTVRSDPRYRQNAGRLQAEIENAPGVDAIEEFINSQPSVTRPSDTSRNQ
jgi:UDP:flavonoid glycosyltransferase YjiC (YdhE family)